MSADTDLGQLTLELDALMCDPALAGLAEAIARSAPVGWRDQHAAARSQAVRGNQRLRDAGVYRDGGRFAPGEVPDWIRLGLLRELVGWCHARGSTCMHSPRAQAPQPVLAAAWRPGLVICMHCPHLLRANSREQDRTCDGCGWIAPEGSRAIHPGQTQAGPFCYVYGMCQGCYFGPPA